MVNSIIRVCFLLLLCHQAPALPEKDVNQTEPGSETTSFCGGIVLHPYGNITSPHYPDHYENMLNCKWHFQAPTSTRIIFQFHQNFSTELGYDRVSIYDGISASSRLLAELSGNETMGHVYSTTSNTATVRFTTDNSLTFTGFAIYYSTEPIPACGGILYTDGTIETPDFPAHYPSSTKCRWIITADADKKIALNFESFQTEPGRDFLNVIDPLTDVPVLIHSGYDVPEPLISPSNQLVLIFHSDHIVNHSGFEITYKIV